MLPQAFLALPSRFDEGQDHPRLVLLVSPTCPLCLAGVELVMKGIDSPEGRLFDLHVVWLPVLENDDEVAAGGSADAIAGRSRTYQYWDDGRVVSSAAHSVLDFDSRRRRIAWDLYLFFRPGARWASPLPIPDRWLHQLEIADQPSLDEATLSSALVEVSTR